MTSKAFGLAQLGNAFADGALSNRNKIINGAMTIDQRNSGAAVTITATSAAQYVLDRWYLRAESAAGSKVSVQRSSVAPAGFSNSQLITSLSAYTIGASEHFATIQFIEGFNVADLNWGTADAQAITFSFKVRSSLTGTFGGFLTNSAGDRVYVFSYTINAADTFETKTITVEGDTTGTWLKDNGAGLAVSFSVAAGSSTTGAAGSWGSTLYRSVTGQTSLVGTSGATFYITGVQLEAGDTATPFEHRSFGQELALCQRYFTSSFPDGTTVANGVTGPALEGPATAFATNDVYCQEISYSVPMRASPTITFYNMAGTSGVSGKWATYDLVWTAATTTATAGANNKGFTPYMARSGAFVRLNSYLYSGHYSASAEL